MNEKVQVLHSEMVYDLSKQVYPECENWKSFIGLLTGHIPDDPATISSIKDMNQAVTVLQQRGKISVGNYKVLQEIFSKMKASRCLEIIENYIEKINKESDGMTILIRVSEQPAASHKKLFCETLKNELNSQLHKIEMAQKNTILGRLSEQGMRFEIASTMQIKCKGVDANLLKRSEPKTRSRMFQENLITEDVLKKCGVESINMDIAMLDEHEDSQTNQEQDQPATKGDIEKLDKKMESLDSRMENCATKREMKEILNVMQQIQRHLAPADNEMSDSSLTKESKQGTRAKRKYEFRDNEMSGASSLLPEESKRESTAKRKRESVDNRMSSAPNSLPEESKQGTTAIRNCKFVDTLDGFCTRFMLMTLPSNLPQEGCTRD